MIKVKYNEKYSHDGYSYKTFDDYKEIGIWFCDNYKKINVWDIKVI